MKRQLVISFLAATILLVLSLPSSAFSEEPSSSFSEAVAGESQMVPADKPFAALASLDNTSEFASLKAYTAKTVVISKKLRKKPKNTYSLAIKAEINKRYAAAIAAVKTRKANAEAAIETAATERERVLTAAADADYNSDYEKLTLDLEIKKQKLLDRKEKAIKKLTKKYTRVVNWPKRNGKIKVISFVPAPKQRVLKRKTKAVERRIKEAIRILNEEIESEKSLLTERYTTQLDQIDGIVTAEKTASYDALNASIKAEEAMIQSEKIQLDKNLTRISRGTYKRSGPNKRIPKAKVKHKKSSKKAHSKRAKKLSRIAKKKTVKKARKIVRN